MASFFSDAHKNSFRPWLALAGYEQLPACRCRLFFSTEEKMKAAAEMWEKSEKQRALEMKDPSTNKREVFVYDIPNLSPDDVVERDSLVFRSYIALGSHQLVLNEIDSSAPTPLQSVKFLALYLSSPDLKLHE